MNRKEVVVVIGVLVDGKKYVSADAFDTQVRWWQDALNREERLRAALKYIGKILTTEEQALYDDQEELASHLHDVIAHATGNNAGRGVMMNKYGAQTDYLRGIE